MADQNDVPPVTPDDSEASARPAPEQAASTPPSASAQSGAAPAATEGAPDDAVAGPRPLQTVLLLVAALILLGIGYLGLSWYAGSKFKAAVNAWQSTGGAVTVEQLAPPATPEAQNAAALYILAAERMPSISALQQQLLINPWNAPQEQIAEVAQLTAPVAEIMADAVERPYARWPLDYTSVDTLQASAAETLEKILVLQPILIVHAIHHYYQDEPAEVDRTLAGAQRLAQHLTSAPLLANLMLRLEQEERSLEAARRLLDKEAVTAPALLMQLADIEYRSLLQEVLSHEVTVAIASFETPNATDRAAATLEAVGQQVPWWYNPAMARLDMAYYLRELQSATRTLGQPLYEQDALAMLGQHPWWAAMSAEALPTTSPRYALNIRIAAAHARAVLARTAIRLRAYHAEHGAYPESLEALGEVPVDPFTGRSIRYQRIGEGFAVGSLGPSADSPINWKWQH